MRRYITLALVSGAALMSACSDNPAAPSRDRVVAGSQQTLQSLVTGIVAQERTNASGSYELWGGIMARDAIVPTANESRFVTEFYNTTPDPSDFIGGSQWTGYYTNIRAIHNLFKDASYTSLPASSQAATRGFLRTLMALEYIQLLEYRDQNGIVIQGDNPAALDPIRTKQSALAYIAALLDSAKTDLSSATGAGVTTVPFTLPSGYSLHGDYTALANIELLNRGLRGKAEVMRLLDNGAVTSTGSAATAITALTQALSDAPGTVTEDYLNKGIWLEFNPSAPESFTAPNVGTSDLLTYNFVNSITPGDARAAAIIPAPKQSEFGDSAAYRLNFTDPTVSSNLSRPIPLVRNAEFYLLRAQAEIAAGDLVSATNDINVVHTVEGGLPPYPTFASASAAIAAVLYEYRYSFAYQGPQHLDALREYGMINAAYVAQPGMPGPGPASDALVQQLPIPQNEQNARGGNITPQP